MKIGAVTIGQSPREDVIPDIGPLLPGVEIIEAGALDALDEDALQNLVLHPQGQTLATRLRNGCQIVIGKDDVLPLVQRGIETLEREKVELILVLCTGPFPAFKAHVPLLYPEKVLQSAVTVAFRGEVLGIVTPHPQQVLFQKRRWSHLVKGRVEVAVASPYQDGPATTLALGEAAGSLRRCGAEMIALDCLGYSEAMRKQVRQVVGVPTLLARSTLARLAAEVLGV